MDSLLASISSGSVATSADTTSNFAASLFTPESTSQSVAVIPPSSTLPASTDALSLLDNSYTASSLSPTVSPDSLFGYNPTPQVSITTPEISSLANELVLDQVSLSSLLVPTEFLNYSQGLASEPGYNFLGPLLNSDPSVPENGSIAMIGTGLIGLSLMSTVHRWRRRVRG
jgi:hypothetical protein